MVECVDPYVVCDIKNIGIEQLLRLMVTVDSLGNPALRSCGGSGGGGAEVLVGESLFVSSAGKLISAGAVRGSLTNHFSNLDEAVSQALTGDTIYVYGGTHLVANNLHVDGVRYVFLGVPMIVAMFSFVCFFNDNGIQSTIWVEGDAVFYHPYYGGGANAKIITVTNSQSVVNFTCSNIVGYGSYLIRLLGGNGFINATHGINKLGNDYMIDLGGNASYVFTAPFFRNENPSLSNLSSCISLNNTYVGNSIINGNLSHAYNRFSPVRIEAIGGSLVINGNIDYMTSIGVSFFIQAIYTNGFTDLTVNGDVTSNAYGYRLAFGSGSKFTHRGKMIGTGNNTQNLIYAYTNNNRFDLFGKYINNGTYIDVINIGGTNHVVFMNNAEIFQNSASGVSQSAYRIEGTGERNLNNVRIVSNLVGGLNLAIVSSVANFIKVLQAGLSSNIPLDVNVTNQIIGTTITVDANLPTLP